jgi:hypothetical protein
LLRLLRLEVVVCLATLALAAPASGQSPAAPPPPAEPFAITDNSFLVEEAFNQERGVVQNIFNGLRAGGAWTATFTQEWPVPADTHQFSYTVSWLQSSPGSGIGDTLLNYRYQALMESAGRPAFSPRLSLMLPSGNADRGRGYGAMGLQVNLPFSKQRGDVYLHWNAGMTWVPRAKIDRDRRELLTSPFLAGSAIYRLRPMLNLMLESVVSFNAVPEELTGTTHSTSVTLSPGARGGWNLGEKQIVIGVAVPVTWTGGSHDQALFTYFSYELPFKKEKGGSK